MITYSTIILISWLAFLAVWGVGALSAKRDIKSGGILSLWTRYWLFRLAIAAFVVFAALRITTGTVRYANPSTIFSHVFFTPSAFLGWVAAFLTALGVAFAIWARVHLGRNWSSHPAVKEDHELVTTGPYAYVRHPIYTGVILAVLGSALTGSIFGIVGFAVISVRFFLRIDKEERIMLNLFPNKYPAYQKRTKRLVPFVW